MFVIVCVNCAENAFPNRVDKKADAMVIVYEKAGSLNKSHDADGKIMEEGEEGIEAGAGDARERDETDDGPQGKEEGKAKSSEGGIWHEIARTEWIQSNNHPVFEKKIEVPIYSGALQKLKFRVLDVHGPMGEPDLESPRTRFLGSVDVSLDLLVGMGDVSRTLTAGDNILHQHMSADEFGTIELSSTVKYGHVEISDGSDDEYDHHDISKMTKVLCEQDVGNVDIGMRAVNLHQVMCERAIACVQWFNILLILECLLQARLVTNNHHLAKRETRFDPDEEYISMPESETSAGEDEDPELQPNYYAELEDTDLDRDSPCGDAMLSTVRPHVSAHPRKDDKIAQSRSQQKRPKRNVILRKHCKNQVVFPRAPPGSSLLSRFLVSTRPLPSLPPSPPPVFFPVSRVCDVTVGCAVAAYDCVGKGATIWFKVGKGSLGRH